MAIRAKELRRLNKENLIQPNQDHLTLANLPRGVQGRVCSLAETNPKELQKLLVFGIIPGQTLRVIQQYPSIVVEVGHTVVAFDQKVASKVIVKPLT